MKKLFAFLLFIFFMMDAAPDVFGQASGGLYTFKYILRPKYKTRLHFQFGSDAVEKKLLHQLDVDKKDEKEYDKNSEGYQNRNLYARYLDSSIKNQEKEKGNSNKKQIPQYLENFFDILFLGTGYNRNFNLTDVIHDDPVNLKYDGRSYIPDYWRLKENNAFFVHLDINSDTVNFPDYVRSFNRPIEFKRINQSSFEKIQNQSYPCLKFNPATQTLDEVDFSQLSTFFPANQFLFPTYKRKIAGVNNIGLSKGENHKKYIKYKYGVDVLYKKEKVPFSVFSHTITAATLAPTKTISPNTIITETTSNHNVIGISQINNAYDTTNKIYFSTTTNFTPFDNKTTEINTTLDTKNLSAETQSTTTGMVSYSIVGKGNTTFAHPLLKCYMVGRIGPDTLVMMPWFRKHVAKRNHQNNLNLIRNQDDGIDSIITFDDQIIAQDVYADTFYFVIPNNYNTRPDKNSNYNKFNLVFNTKYLIPINITFQDVGFSIHKPVVLQSNFLSAGMAYGWAHGKATFFKNDQVTQKNFYVGAGFVASLSAASDTSKTSVNKGNMVPALCVGAHIGVAVSAIQVLIAGGYGMAAGDSQTPWGKNGEPWVGVGIGLSLFSLALPAIGNVGGSK